MELSKVTLGPCIATRGFNSPTSSPLSSLKTAHVSHEKCSHGGPWHLRTTTTTTDDGANSDGVFELDLAALHAAFTSRTKVFIYNSPHNPTGVVFTQQEMEAGVSRMWYDVVLTQGSRVQNAFDDVVRNVWQIRCCPPCHRMLVNLTRRSRFHDEFDDVVINAWRALSSGGGSTVPGV